ECCCWKMNGKPKSVVSTKNTIAARKQPRPRSLWLVCLLSPLQLDPKSTPAIEFGFSADFTAHPLNGAPDNGQTHSGPFISLRRMQTLEHPEQTLLSLLVNSYAIIFKPESDAATFFLGPNPDFGMCALFDKLYRVAEQIREHLR